MKLHAIGATNLNSLYGEQRLDLDEDLGGATLFLICGPTGAGKSTLMDAVSIALFGKTPRLDSRAPTDVAGEIMSRGAGEASAEVVFSKLQDGRRTRYRAIWTAHRARKHADGNVQAPHRSLERQQDDGTWDTLVSSDRSQTYKRAFNEVLEDFSVQDFQRTMLLAQGNFDALIKANTDERASILERLTQTGEYKEYGARAAAMNTAWNKRLGQLKVLAESQSQLSEQEEQDARLATASATERLGELAVQHAGLDLRRRWLVQQAELDKLLTAAKASLKAVGERQENAAADLAALAEHRRCAAAESLLRDRGRLADRARKHAEKQAELRAALPALDAERDAHKARSDAAERAALLASEALTALRKPVADAVQAARTHRDAAGEQTKAARLEKQANEALQGPGGARELLTHAQTKAAAATTELEVSKLGLAALAGDEAVAATLPDWVAEAEGVRTEARGLRNAQRDAEQQTAKLVADAKALADDQAGYRAAQTTKLAPLADALAAAAKVLAKLLELAETADEQALSSGAQAELAELERALERMGREQTLLQTACATGQTRDKAAERSEQQAGALKQAQRKIELAKTAEDIAKGTLVDADEAVNQAVKRMVPFERYLALERERAELAPEQACPLCGSDEHPYRDDPTARALTEGFADALRNAQREHGDATVHQQAASEAHAGAQKVHFAAQGLADERAKLAAQAQADVRDATAAAEGAAQAAGLAATATTAAVQQAQNALASRVAATTARRQQVSAAAAVHTQCITSLRTATEQLREQGTALKQRAAKLEQRGRDADQALDKLTDRESGVIARGAELVMAIVEAGVATDAGPRRAGDGPADADKRDADKRDADKRDADEHDADEHDADEHDAGEHDADEHDADERDADERDAVAALLQRVQRALAAAQARATAWQSASARVDKAQQGVRTAELMRDAARDALRAAEARLVKAQKEAHERGETLSTAAAAEQTAREALTAAWAGALATDPAGTLGLPKDAATGGPPDALLEAVQRHVAALAGAAKRLREALDKAAGAAQDARTMLATLDGQAGELAVEAAAAEQALGAALTELGLADAAALAERLLAPDRLAALQTQADELKTAHATATGALLTAAAQHAEHQTARPVDLAEDADIAGLQRALDDLAAARKDVEDALQKARAVVAVADQEAARLAGARATLAAAAKQAAIWQRLHSLIGVDNGARFKEFAQALNLDQLLRQANRHLARLRDRYRLRVVRDEQTGMPTLDFDVEDREAVGARRSLKTLSGGESFLASLALALGLSDLRTTAMPIETLLLDEGFGTLDPETLDVALAALRELQINGRQVGIISHVVGLRERVPAVVEVAPLGEGRSRIRVPTS